MQHVFMQVCDLSITKTLKQHWTQEKFSYLHKPRPDHGLMLLISGRIDFITPVAVLQAQAGNVIFLPKGCRYEAVFRTALGPVDNYLINFDADSLHADSAAPQLLLKNAAAACTGHFQRLVEERRLHSLSPLRERGMLLLLLDAIFHSPDTPHSATLEHACSLLQETDLSVREIAHRCSVSESGLRALFQAQLHTSPLQYRLSARLNRAAYLLESTDLTMNEIAEQIRFYDAAAFCRMFKRRYGQTPRQYAQSKKL